MKTVFQALNLFKRLLQVGSRAVVSVTSIEAPTNSTTSAAFVQDGMPILRMFLIVPSGEQSENLPQTQFF